MVVVKPICELCHPGSGHRGGLRRFVGQSAGGKGNGHGGAGRIPENLYRIKEMIDFFYLWILLFFLPFFCDYSFIWFGSWV